MCYTLRLLGHWVFVESCWRALKMFQDFTVGVRVGCATDTRNAILSIWDALTNAYMCDSLIGVYEKSMAVKPWKKILFYDFSWYLNLQRER